MLHIESKSKIQILRNKRIIDRRKALLETFSCICCGNSDSTVIEWHHVNPKDKGFTLFAGTNSEERWWLEVLKCIPVCANCHKKIHKEKLCLIPLCL